MEQWDIKGSIAAFFNDDRVRIAALGLAPAVLMVGLAILGGVRDLLALFLIGLASFAIVSGTFLLLPREGKKPAPRFDFPKSSPVGPRVSSSDKPASSLSWLGEQRANKPNPSSNVDWFDPSIDEDTLINVLVYLSSNGFTVDSSIKSLLTDQQDQKLRAYLVEKGLAYDTDEIYEGGWALNAAGRSVMNRYLTYLLVHDEDSGGSDAGES